MIMANGKLKIATCQFAVSADIKANAQSVCKFITSAAHEGADIVHFPECAMSGYAGVDVGEPSEIDWSLLESQTQKAMALAGKFGVWAVLGSTHRLTEPNKPTNCQYLINPKGMIEDRYDKRFLMPGDIGKYTAGNRTVIFEINGVRCALMICFELRFPELYRDMKRQNVQCIIQSFYNARQNGPSVHSHIMQQTMQCHAACNYFWVSMANSSAAYQPYSSCFIQPDGMISGKLPCNRPAMMINTVDLSRDFYDPMKGSRELAMAGEKHNGQTVHDDPRMTDTKSL